MIYLVSSLNEKGIKADTVGPDSSETENKGASKGEYNLVVITGPRSFVWQSSVHDSNIEEQNRSCIH